MNCPVCHKHHDGTSSCCVACLSNSRRWKARHRLQNLCISHRAGDRHRDRYDADNHVTREHLIEQLETQYNRCYHCYVLMDIGSGRVHNGMWLQRLNNKIGHTCGNTVLACRSCNVRRVEDGINDVWLEQRRKQVELDELIDEGYQLLQTRTAAIH